MKRALPLSLSAVFLQSYLILWRVPQTSAFTRTNCRRCCSSQIFNQYESSRHTVLKTRSRSQSTGEGVETVTDEAAVSRTSFPRRLVRALDLSPFVRLVAVHTATRRGYDAMLSLVSNEDINSSP